MHPCQHPALSIGKIYNFNSITPLWTSSYYSGIRKVQLLSKKFSYKKGDFVYIEKFLLITTNNSFTVDLLSYKHCAALF